MNIPFPILYPRLVDPNWFNSDSPCDEDAELTSMEEAHQKWLNSIGQQYMKHAPLGGKPEVAEAMEEEADSDDDEEEEGNEESDDSEESHDEDEDEELRRNTPPRNNNELEAESPQDNNDASELNTPDQSAYWPVQ